MSLRLRLPAPPDHPAISWPETVTALAEVHRSRRAVHDTSRWPLAHACTHVRRSGSDSTDGTRYPFCCRAVG
jgi:hypothetical protein